MQLRGRVVDYGDLLYHEEWLVKGRHLRLVFRVGVPRDVSPGARDRGPETGPLATARRVNPTNPAPSCTPNRGVSTAVDLQADKQVTLSVTWTDEVGNPTPAPADAVVAYTVDDATVINLTDNGDGTAVAAATGELGDAVVHAEATATGLPTVTGDLLIVVVAGDAERLEIVAGEPTEVTPDSPPPTGAPEA